MMESEFKRLASFVNFLQEFNSPLTLARCGFWYTGTDDEVECFSCKTRFNARDDPMGKHRERASRCEFLRNTNVNIPLKVSNCSHQRLTETTTKHERRGDTVTDDCGPVTRGPQLSRNVEMENLRDKSCQLVEIYYSACKRAKKNGVILNENESRIDRSRPDYELLKDEQNRLNTFYDWPSTANANPIELAREGLFYTGIDDKVQCTFCKGCIRSWELGDVPSAEHKKHFPNCPFVLRRSDVGNVTFGSEVPSCTVDRASTTSDQQISVTADEQIARATLSQITTEDLARETASPQVINQLALPAVDSAQFPQYRDYSARVESFRNKTVAPGHTAEGLADAGWFYVGPNDKVRCFQCGGNLRDWEPEDDPWVEHRRWYDHCQYIKTHTPRPRVRAPETIPPMIPSTAVSYRIEPREIKARMDTPTVRAILDMGYSREKVRAVIETRLSTTGDDFVNAESLLEALFQLEESTSTGQTGATASALDHGATSNSIYRDSFSSSVASSRTSGYSTASSSASETLRQLESASLPVVSSSNAMTVSVQPKTSVSKHSGSPALTQEAVSVQSKAKGKKKKNKKKKQTSATSSSAASGEDNAAIEEHVERTHNDLERTNVEGEPSLEEIPDIPDEEAMKYLEENRQLRDARTCKVCMDAEVNTVFLPCGHLVCCATCSPHLRNCPICRTFIRGTVKTFLS